ncbi:MAG TPA: hypothetical protein VN873_07360 [Candidatus Angelobacter sp.]|nr:hypothetical protein [Candidatus Angelobacter sp.]
MTDAKFTRSIWPFFNCRSLFSENTLLTALMGGADWSWRVTGITAKALEMLASVDFKNVKGIRRAHLVDRIDTARAVFHTSSPLTEDEFFATFWENDKTVIATISENKMGGTLSRIIPIDYRLGLFAGKAISFQYLKREASFLRDLHAKSQS